MGCCSLRVEHLELKTESLEDENGQKQDVRMVEFDFLGKDSIRYYNLVKVPKIVYKCLIVLMKNKEPKDDVFDKLTTASLNKYLQSLMPGLTAKVVLYKYYWFYSIFSNLKSMNYKFTFKSIKLNILELLVFKHQSIYLVHIDRG